MSDKVGLQRPTAAWFAVTEAFIIIVGACCVSLALGQDNNWDLHNYHIYNPYAFLSGRYGRDLYAAGLQSYFNPIIDIPYYVLAVKLIPEFPRLVVFLSGIPYGLLVWAVLRIARITLPAALPWHYFLAIAVTAFGVIGSTTNSEIGTTIGDIPVAVLILVGLSFPLALLSREKFDDGRWIGALVVAGSCAGLAAGLKPVAAMFAPGMVLGLAMMTGDVRRFVLTGFIFSMCWLACFAVAFVPWAMTPYVKFGNPVFPLMNHIFGSPWAPPLPYADERFLPKDIWQKLFYPFFWISGRAVVTELNVRDPRFALAYVSLVILSCRTVLGHWRGRGSLCGAIGRPAVAICLFFVVSFVIWEPIFSILRYIMTLEVLTGIVIVLALSVLLPGFRRDRAHGYKVLAVTALVLGLGAAITTPLSWGRLRTYGAAVFEVEAPPLPDHAAVAFVNAPTAFVAPFLKGNDLMLVGFTNLPRPSRLISEIARRIESRPSIVAIFTGPGNDLDDVTAEFGFRIQRQSCVRVRSNIDPDLHICNGERIGSGKP